MRTNGKMESNKIKILIREEPDILYCTFTKINNKEGLNLCVGLLFFNRMVKKKSDNEK